ncbi:hypothetical protein, partial [Enterococcus hirae]|uniref:hypothetical protein n=1 Tax=Enterococcus hirae TaxID=1354 RepID=UPI001369EB07
TRLHRLQAARLQLLDAIFRAEVTEARHKIDRHIEKLETLTGQNPVSHDAATHIHELVWVTERSMTQLPEWALGPADRHAYSNAVTLADNTIEAATTWLSEHPDTHPSHSLVEEVLNDFTERRATLNEFQTREDLDGAITELAFGVRWLWAVMGRHLPPWPGWADDPISTNAVVIAYFDAVTLAATATETALTWLGEHPDTHPQRSLVEDKLESLADARALLDVFDTRDHLSHAVDEVTHSVWRLGAAMRRRLTETPPWAQDPPDPTDELAVDYREGLARATTAITTATTWLAEHPDSADRENAQYSLYELGESKALLEEAANPGQVNNSRRNIAIYVHELVRATGQRMTQLPEWAQDPNSTDPDAIAYRKGVVLAATVHTNVTAWLDGHPEHPRRTQVTTALLMLVEKRIDLLDADTRDGIATASRRITTQVDELETLGQQLTRPASHLPTDPGLVHAGASPVGVNPEMRAEHLAPGALLPGQLEAGRE